MKINFIELIQTVLAPTHVDTWDDLLRWIIAVLVGVGTITFLGWFFIKVLKFKASIG